jgi:flagellar basal body-associated protein FliL
MYRSTEQSGAKDRGSAWIPLLLVLNTAFIVILGIGLFLVRGGLGDQNSKFETMAQEMKQAQGQTEKRFTDLASDLAVTSKRIGVTADELGRARQAAQALKQQQEEAEKELAAKANSTDIDALRTEATTKMTELQQDANTKLGNVSGEVSGIKQDLAATRDEFGRQLVDVKNVLSDGIARNSSELADLRKKGERDYFEFDIRKDSKHPLQRVADVQLALTKSDPKNHKYSVAIQVDDNRLEKKDRTTNEPVQFLVGRDQLRYEIVVNAVDKDRIRGYLSAPKDKVLSAEVPTLRQQ